MDGSGGEPGIHIGDRTIPFEEAVRRVRGSAAWFHWIAGLSLLNSVAVRLQWDFTMLVGLGVTQVVDGFALLMLQEAAPEDHIIIHAVATLVAILFAAFFVTMGILSQRLWIPAYVVGMLLYALDGILFLLFGDYLSLGFHGFVLLMLSVGLKTTIAIRRAGPRTPEEPEPVRAVERQKRVGISPSFLKIVGPFLVIASGFGLAYEFTGGQGLGMEATPWVLPLALLLGVVMTVAGFRASGDDNPTPGPPASPPR